MNKDDFNNLIKSIKQARKIKRGDRMSLDCGNPNCTKCNSTKKIFKCSKCYEVIDYFEIMEKCDNCGFVFKKRTVWRKV